MKTWIVAPYQNLIWGIERLRNYKLHTNELTLQSNNNGASVRSQWRLENLKIEVAINTNLIIEF